MRFSSMHNVRHRERDDPERSELLNGNYVENKSRDE